jgi:hypothetical protein
MPTFAKASAGYVGRRGFEPLKSKDSGFTVRPIWPLWNLPLEYFGIFDREILELQFPNSPISKFRNLFEPLVGIEPTTY